METHGASPSASSMTFVKPRRRSRRVGPSWLRRPLTVRGQNVLELFDVVQGEVGGDRELPGRRRLLFAAQRRQREVFRQGPSRIVPQPDWLSPAGLAPALTTGSCSTAAVAWRTALSFCPNSRYAIASRYIASMVGFCSTIFGDLRRCLETASLHQTFGFRKPKLLESGRVVMAVTPSTPSLPH